MAQPAVDHQHVQQYQTRSDYATPLSNGQSIYSQRQQGVDGTAAAVGSSSSSSPYSTYHSPATKSHGGSDREQGNGSGSWNNNNNDGTTTKLQGQPTSQGTQQRSLRLDTQSQQITRATTSPSLSSHTSSPSPASAPPVSTVPSLPPQLSNQQVTLESLMSQYGNSQSAALNALVQRYNSLASSSTSSPPTTSPQRSYSLDQTQTSLNDPNSIVSKIRTEHSLLVDANKKLQSENSKLWNWAGNLKKESRGWMDRCLDAEARLREMGVEPGNGGANGVNGAGSEAGGGTNANSGGKPPMAHRSHSDGPQSISSVSSSTSGIGTPRGERPRKASAGANSLIGGAGGGYGSGSGSIVSADGRNSPSIRDYLYQQQQQQGQQSFKQPRSRHGSASTTTGSTIAGSTSALGGQGEGSEGSGSGSVVGLGLAPAANILPAPEGQSQPSSLSKPIPNQRQRSISSSSTSTSLRNVLYQSQSQSQSQSEQQPITTNGNGVGVPPGPSPGTPLVSSTGPRQLAPTRKASSLDLGKKAALQSMAAGVEDGEAVGGGGGGEGAESSASASKALAAIVSADGHGYGQGSRSRSDSTSPSIAMARSTSGPSSTVTPTGRTNPDFTISRDEESTEFGASSPRQEASYTVSGTLSPGGAPEILPLPPPLSPLFPNLQSGRGSSLCPVGKSPQVQQAQNESGSSDTKGLGIGGQSFQRQQQQQQSQPLASSPAMLDLSLYNNNITSASSAGSSSTTTTQGTGTTNATSPAGVGASVDLPPIVGASEASSPSRSRLDEKSGPGQQTGGHLASVPEGNVYQHQQQQLHASARPNLDRKSSNESRYPISSPIPQQQQPQQQQHQPQLLRRPTLIPTWLPFTRVAVMGSQIKPDGKNREILVFSVSVQVNLPPEHDPEGYGGTATWVVEKMYSDVLTLDSSVKAKNSKNKIGSVPDKSLFKDHAPSRVDQRKEVLGKYLQDLLRLDLRDATDICAFFLSNVAVQAQSPVASPGHKDGYLTKKGRNFGKWQTRFYAISPAPESANKDPEQGPVAALHYYDTRGGTHRGYIEIKGAKVGRQNKKESDPNNEDAYRHAFMLIEANSTHHILCAESDIEREEWVQVLACYTTGRYIPMKRTAGQTTPATTRPSTGSSSLDFGQGYPQVQTQTQTPIPTQVQAQAQAQKRSQRKLSKDEISKGSALPISALSPEGLNSKLLSTVAYDEPRVSNDLTPPFATHKRENSYGSSITSSDDQRNPLRRAQQMADMHPSSSLPSNLDAGGRPSFAEGGNRSNSELGQYPDLRDPRAMLAPNSRGLAHHRFASHGSDPVGGEDGRSGYGTSKSNNETMRPTTPETRARDDIAAQAAQRFDTSKISGPMGGGPISASNFKSKEDRRTKAKSSFWSFAGRNAEKHPAPAPQPMFRIVFGVPLEEAVQVARIREGLELPAVIYRCVEYLEDKAAEMEEGIYRLSGSSNVIKALKDRFNTEGDVNLLASSDYYDPHAVAGLLKTFLRELPTHVLTPELYPDFIRITDLANRKDKVNELGRLITELPLANYTLLRFLTAHLIHIVRNEKQNKMSLRNVGIVFSPTLRMPASLFALLLSEFDYIFNMSDGDVAPRQISDDESATPSISLPETSSQQMHATPSPREVEGNETGTRPQHLRPRADAERIAERRRSRNSMLYSETGADKLEFGGKLEEPKEEEENDFETESVPGEEDLASSSEEGPGGSAGGQSATYSNEGDPVLPVPISFKEGKTHVYHQSQGSGSLTIDVPHQGPGSLVLPRSPSSLHSSASSSAPRSPGLPPPPRSPGLPSSPRPGASFSVRP